MQTLAKKLLGLAGALLLAATASGQPYSIDSFTIAGGSGTLSAGAYSISGTVGQPDAALGLAGGDFLVVGGFWSLLGAGTPPVEMGSATIFDNATGSENGGIGASSNIWLAGKFCVGSQPYQLDSVSLLLSSGNFGGFLQPPSTVRLQIYSNDPVSGKPSAGRLIMNLSDLTNPVTLLPSQWVKWTTGTPFRLSADTCYWVVFSNEGPGAGGQIVSFTMPTGAAGAFGQIRSTDAGSTWLAPDDLSNFKMQIQATPVSSPSLTAEAAADESTAIPGGTGHFTSLPRAPSLSGTNLAFYGAGSGGQEGIYLSTRGSVKAPSRIADTATPIPGGTGNFLSFSAGSGITIVGGDVLFSGSGSGSQKGIYLANRALPQESVLPQDPYRIADTATAIPGGAGTFTGFQNTPGFSGKDVAFVGSGSGGQQGLYTVAVLSPPQVGSPLRIADTTTPIPGGSGNFTAFPSGPALSGNAVAFIGNGSAAQQGLYEVALISPPQVGSPLRIADTATSIPGGSGNFTAFGSDQAHPIDPAMSGDRLAFIGSGSGGQQGVYVANRAIPTEPFVPGNPVRIADTATAIPGGSGNFSSFGAVSISETDLAFLGHGGGGQTGIYDMTGGRLLKVIAVGERIGGKRITGLKLSSTGLSGDPVSFEATFSDGSQGVFTMDVIPPPAELRIAAAERIGNDLQLSFNSVAGQNYSIESRADLATGGWSIVPGSTIVGAGATARVTIPDAFTQRQRFYRLKQGL